MTLVQQTELYAAILRQLLPIGGYDNAPQCIVAADIYGHATVLAQADLNAKRLLSVISIIAPELIREYERDYGLPLKCTTNAALPLQERIDLVNEIIAESNVINKAYVTNMLARFGVGLIELVTYKPMQCTASCTAAVNTEQLRYKVTLKLQSPINADMDCINKNYLPAFLRVDVEEV